MSVKMIFGQGGLTPDEELCEFRKGIVGMVERDLVPVVPMAMSNMFGSAYSLAKGNKIVQILGNPWRHVDLDIEPPIAPEHFDLKKMKKRILELLKIRKGS